MNNNNGKDAIITVWKNDSQRNYIYSYSSQIAGKNLKAYYAEGGSASVSKTVAKNKAVFEAAERYSGSNIPKHLKRESYKKMNNAINPNTYIFFDRQQYKNRFPYRKFKLSDQIEWVKGKSLIDLKHVFIPAFATYLGYNQRIPVSEKYFPTASCGLAIQNTKKQAIINGIFELAERDAAMKVWLNKSSPPIVDLSTTHSKKLKKMLINLNKEGLIPKVALSTQNIPIPSFMAIVFPIRDTIPYVTIGLSAGANIEKTILKSLEEAIMIRNSLEYAKRESGESVSLKSKAQVKSFFDHVLYYSFPSRKTLWKSMIAGPLVTINQLKRRFQIIDLQTNTYKTLIGILRKFKFDVYAVDLTSDIAKEMGLYCFKVIVPSFRQMEIDHKFKFLKYGNKTDQQKLRKSQPHPFA